MLRFVGQGEGARLTVILAMVATFQEQMSHEFDDDSAPAGTVH